MPGKGTKRKQEGLARSDSVLAAKASKPDAVAVASAETKAKSHTATLDSHEIAEIGPAAAAKIVGAKLEAALKAGYWCEALPVGCGKTFASPQRKKQHQHAGNARGGEFGRRPCGERAADRSVTSLEQVENKCDIDNGVVKSVTTTHMFSAYDPRKQGDNLDDTTYSVLDPKTGR